MTLERNRDNIERETLKNKNKSNLLKLVGAYIRTIREAKIYEHELASELQALNLSHASQQLHSQNRTKFGKRGKEKHNVGIPSCFRDW
jgi:hypothetical protein